jgi:hypothetical protein
MGMVEISFRLVDFMDARPLPGAAVEFTLTVAPLFAVLPDDGPGPPQPPRPDERLAESLRRTVVTGVDGRAALSFDAGDVFSRLTGLERDDPPGHSVGAAGTLNASTRLLGINLPRADLAGGLGPAERLEHTLPADLGMSLVGHTTPETARLWFHLPFEPAADHSFTCHVAAAGDGLPPAAGPLDPATDLGPGFELTFDPASNTAVARTTGLLPGRTQDYALVLQRGIDRFVLAGGRFATPAADQRDLAFAFGSCHLPVVTGTPDEPSSEALRSLELWQRLDERDDSELLLLIGDQIYGDGIEEKWPDEDDFSRYLRRYRQLWAHRPTRSVLRSIPTYMILDDHDVADDFGLGDLDDNKVDGALLAYRVFQHAHGPSDSLSAPFHYSFRRGPAAFFVMDGRTQRGEGTPVFGQRQLADLRAWAGHPDTRAADLIFFVAPVPLALLPSETIRKIVDELTEETFVTAGVLAGLALGLLIPAPFPGIGGALTDAAVLGAVGYGAAEVLEDHIDRTLLLKADLGERWDLAGNQPDLVRLLDLLFDLANGVGDDPPRKRAVFILSGDIHAATMHLIRSMPAGRGLQHRANPLITQLTSSAISHEPVNSTLWAEAVSRIDEELDLDLKDINVLQLFREGADWERLSKDVIDTDDVFGDGKGEYFLDSDHDRRYLTQYAGLLMERTVGHVDVQRTSLQRRAYRIGLTIEGQSGEQLESVLNVDLDAPSPSGLILDAAALSFAVSQAGGSDTRSVMIENIAGAAVDVTVLPPPGGPFSWQPAAFRLQHAETRAVQIRFQATSSAIARGRLTLTSSAPNSPHRVALTGKGPGGFPPDDPDAPQRPGDVELAPGLVNFGSVALNSSETRTATITNKTGAAVTLAAPASASNAQFRWSGFQAVLVNNAKRTVTITFHPAANGPQRGRFIVRNTATGESHAVDLIGRGGIGGFPAPPEGH